MSGLEIILVEDEEALAIGIEYSLKKEGYDVVRISNFAEGIEFFKNNKNTEANRLGLFDVMLPDGDGFELFRRVRAFGNNMPVIFLTAVSDEISVLKGLDLGADDYIAKPFRLKELMARVRAVSRRCFGNEIKLMDSKINYRRLVVDEQAMKVYLTEGENTENTAVTEYNSLEDKNIAITRHDNPEQKLIELTANEYKLLLLFLHNQGIVLERKVILDKLFDSNGNFVDDNTLSVYIRRLREKIGDNDKTAPYIKTVHGVGYIMEKEDA